MRRRKDNKDNKEKKAEQKQARRDAFMKLGMIFLAVLLVADTIQIARFGEIVERVDTYNKGVVDELGGFRQDIVAFGNDINEMRSFLLLPTKTYSFMDEDIEIKEDDEKEASATEKALYQFMSAFVEEETIAKNAEISQTLIQSFSTDAELKEALAEYELTVGGVEKDEFSSSFKVSSGGESLFAIVADTKTGEIKIQSAIGSYLVQEADEAEIKSEIADYLVENKEKVQQMKQKLEDQKSFVTGLVNDESVSAILAEKKLALLDTAVEDDTAIKYSIVNSEDVALLEIVIARADGSISLNKTKYESRDAFKDALVKALGELDGSTSLEKLVTERRAELEEVINQEPFQDLLKTNSLTIDTEPREEYNKLVYDVKDEAGTVKFSFVIELSSGYFKVLKDNEEIDLYSALMDGSKKKP